MAPNYGILQLPLPFLNKQERSLPEKASESNPPLQRRTIRPFLFRVQCAIPLPCENNQIKKKSLFKKSHASGCNSWWLTVTLHCFFDRLARFWLLSRLTFLFLLFLSPLMSVYWKEQLLSRVVTLLDHPQFDTRIVVS